MLILIINVLLENYVVMGRIMYNVEFYILILILLWVRQLTGVLQLLCRS